MRKKRAYKLGFISHGLVCVCKEIDSIKGIEWSDGRVTCWGCGRVLVKPRVGVI